jgi:hypothetical protein
MGYTVEHWRDHYAVMKDGEVVIEVDSTKEGDDEIKELEESEAMNNHKYIYEVFYGYLNNRDMYEYKTEFIEAENEEEVKMILYKKYKNRIFKSIDIKICNEEEP